MTGRCPCGCALHYRLAAIEQLVEQAIETLGPTVPVETPMGTYFVPRHFCALHNVTAATVPQLARQYHWERREEVS